MMETAPLTESMVLNASPRMVYWRTSYVADLDTLTAPGQYYTAASTMCANPPSKNWVGIVEVFYRGTKPMQRITATDGTPYIHVRAMKDNGTWFPWSTFAPNV